MEKEKTNFAVWIFQMSRMKESLYVCREMKKNPCLHAIMTMDFTENENVEWFLKRQIFTLPETLLHFDLGFIISF